MILVSEYGMVYFITRSSRIFKNRILSLLTHVARSNLTVLTVAIKITRLSYLLWHLHILIRSKYIKSDLVIFSYED